MMGTGARGAVALVAVPAALLVMFGGVATADGDGGADGDPGTSLQQSGSTAASAASSTLVEQCTSAVTKLASSVASPTTAQAQAISSADAACAGLGANATSFQSVLGTLTGALTGSTTPTTTPATSGTSNTSGTSGTSGTGDTLTAGSPSAATTSTADVDCPDVDKAVAQAILDADPSDPNNLDADNDGEACDASSAVATNYTGYPTGGVAAGDGSTDGPSVGLLALSGMGGLLAAAGATKLWFVRRGTGV